MKKNYVLYLIIALVLIAIVISLTAFDSNKNKSKDGLLSVKDFGYDKPIEVFTSNETKPMEKDGIEAISVELFKLDNSLKVVTTLKNNSKESLDGFLIQLELLDKDGNVVFPMAANSEVKFEIGQTTQIETYATIDENTKNIVDVRISSIEKTVDNVIEESLQELDN